MDDSSVSVASRRSSFTNEHIKFFSGKVNNEIESNNSESRRRRRRDEEEAARRQRRGIWSWSSNGHEEESNDENNDVVVVAGTAIEPSMDDSDWFDGVEEIQYSYAADRYDDYDVDSLFAIVSSFVPPPPRPPYLPDESLPTDGLTTCDLCSWALRNDRYSFSLDGTIEAPGEIGWLLTLIIVSLISAGIGAVVMVTLLHCRRLKSANGRANSASCCGVALDEEVGSSSASHRRHHHHHHRRQDSANPAGGGVILAGPGPGGVGLAVIPDRPPLELDKLPPYHDVATPSGGHNVNVWSWLSTRRGGGPAGCVVGSPLSLPGQHHHSVGTLSLPVENHYTHMQQADEALYAELDSQAASYASGSEDKHYHELDAVGLHRQHQDTVCSRHSQRRACESEYEMYENGPSLVLPSPHHHHHHHHVYHHVLDKSGGPGSHQHHYSAGSGGSGGEGSNQPSYQNTAYTGSDNEPDNSAPSSAYYSDLSAGSAAAAATAATNQHHPHHNLQQQQQQQQQQQTPQHIPVACCGHPEDDAPPIYEPAPNYRLTSIREAAQTANTCSSDYI
ncbi:uncharacterized protein LOC106658371 [Trichogramma pretiosum]|uniref:uncharacterized protein LOC106658371 n=1 Tax=Trichogramma pretiosum TaxID=7493 RepID=UPI000C7188E2|nr:uncharacterized protein LOC106658371 [Trichogramma pretiosum]